jgi:hypothetical protein
MDKRSYITNLYKKILRENLEEKAESLMNKLNYDETLKLNKDREFDYVQEGKSMCNECGGMMTEGECNECGYQNEEIIELGGMEDGHPRFGNKNLSKMSRKEKDDLMGDRDYEDSFDDDDDYEEFDFSEFDDDDSDFEDDIDYGNTKYGLGDDDDEEEYYPELRISSDMPSYKTKYGYSDNEEEITEKLHGKQHKIDKNKNNRIDAEDFKMLRKQQDEEQLYEVEFDKNEFKEGSKPDFLDLDNDGNKKEPMKSAARDAKKNKKKEKIKESILFTETDLIDLIERLVNEDKSNIKVSEPKGYAEYEKAHKADKKENEDYLKSVAKKMADYLKGASDKYSKYEMKETSKFPTENGGMKAKRKKYTPSDAVDEYIEAFSYPGQTNLVYDEIKPSDEHIKGQLVGNSKNGNAQVDKDGKPLGNVVPSEVGERFYKNFQENLYGQEQQQASYKRQPQPVDQAGENTERGSLKSKRGKKTSQSVLNKLEESTNKESKQLNEEFDRIQQLMGYNRKTQ